MQCKELEAVLEYDRLSPLPPEASEHLASCSSCQDLLADLSAIVVAAKGVPAEEAPPDRIWISIRAQLEAEGVIRDEPVATPVPSLWWSGFADLFRPRALAAAGAVLALILASIYFMGHRSPLETTHAPQAVAVQAPAKQSTPVNPAVAPEGKPVLAATNKTTRPNNTVPSDTPPEPRPSMKELTSSPTENAYLGESAAVLNETEGALPRSGYTGNAAADASFRQNLRTLNEFIAECETRLKQNPQDELTREYLNSAYQQKAELLTAMMDSGRSEH
jgi:hypothetical protein